MNKGLWTCSWPERRDRAMAWATEQPGWLKSALSAAAKTTPPITTVLSTHNTTENSFTINPSGPVEACGNLQSQDQSLCRVGGSGRPHIWDPQFPPLQVWSSLRPWPLACSSVNIVTLR